MHNCLRLLIIAAAAFSTQLSAQPLTKYQVRHADLAAESQRQTDLRTEIGIYVMPEPSGKFKKSQYRLDYGDNTVNRPGTSTSPTGVVGAGLTLENSFESIDLIASAPISGSNFTPPDTMGAVGPTQFFTAQNGVYRIHDKLTGAPDFALDVSASAFWGPAVDPTDSGGGDPRVRFDRLTDTWIVIAFDTAGGALANNRLLIAQSDTATISGATVWTQWFIVPMNTAGGALEAGCFADYPMIGVDVNAIYIGANMFPQVTSCGTQAPGNANTSVFVLPKAQLPGGGGDASAVTTDLSDLLVSVPIWSPMPVDNYDPAATEGYIIGHDATSDTTLKLGKISNPDGAPGTPSVTWFDITVSNKNDGHGNGVPYPGVPAPNGLSTWGLDPLGFRPLGGAQVRDGRLWISMTSSVDTVAGNLRLWPATGDRHSLVWFEIDVNSNTLIQEGNIFDSVNPTDPTHIYLGSVNVNGQGHAVAVATGNNTTDIAPSGYWAGRLAGDAPGTFSEPAIYFAGTVTGTDMRQSFESNPRATRWGDYAQVTVDPCDDMTFYGIAEYRDTPDGAFGGNWATAVAQISAPAPTFDSASPPNVPPGEVSSNVSVTGAGFYSPPVAGAPACRTDLEITTDYPGLVVNSVSFTDAGSFELDLDTTAAAEGIAELTIINPDGQEVLFSLGIGDNVYRHGFEESDAPKP